MSPLSFAIVDDLAHAHLRGKLARGNLKHRWRVENVGPLAELIGLSTTNHLPDWILGEHIDLGSTTWIVDLAARKGRRFTNSAGITPAILPLPEEFFSFMRHAASCAEKAGFPSNDADRLASALGELRGNIEDHSESANTGFLYYAGSNGRFEIGAVDHGIGVLQSLRSCPEHRHLSTEGDALRLAVSDGGSRFGSKSNHGHGFRPIFVGLANHRGHLRFRSGGYSLEIDGQDPKAMPTTIAQKPRFSGFSVSVTCQP